MKNIILESNCASSTVKNNSNSQWETNFNQDYQIEQGDYIMLKNVFINENQLQVGNITIDRDITLNFEFGYYVINGFQFYQNLNFDTHVQPNYRYYLLPNFTPDRPTDTDMGDLVPFSVYSDFKPYVLHSENAGVYELIKNTISLDILAGVYSPNQIANYITSKLSTIPATNILQQNNSPNFFTGTNLMVNMMEAPYVNCYFLPSYNFVTNMTTLNKFQLREPTDPDQNAVTKTSVPVSLSPTYYLGTSQFSLDYNAENQTFQFSYFHTPLQDPVSGSIGIGIGRYYSFVTPDQFISPLHVQTKQCGIFFTDLNSVYKGTTTKTTFWQDLGFNLNDLIVDVSSGIDTDVILQKTTDTQLGINAIFGARSYNSSNLITQTSNYSNGAVSDYDLFVSEPLYVTNTNNLPIVGRNTYTSNTSGYYFINCELGGIGSVINDGNDNRNEIFGIISKYFTSNDFVNAYSDSSIVYVHNSSKPALLSSVKISILDNNKNLLTSLKPNSSIFLQLVKNSETVNVPQNPKIKS